VGRVRVMGRKVGDLTLKKGSKENALKGELSKSLELRVNE